MRKCPTGQAIPPSMSRHNSVPNDRRGNKSIETLKGLLI